MATPNRINLEPAFVLHRRPYRDTSLLVEAVSREHGRIGLVAKGVRRSRSAMAGLLQPFQPLLLSWSGKGELFTLIGAEAGGRALPLIGTALFSGFYLNELMIRLLPRHDPHPALFDVYAETMAALTEPSGGEWSLRLFEKRLLDELGYGLLLTEEAGTGRPIQPEARYCYHLESGPVQARTGGLMVAGRTLLALAGERLPVPEDRAPAKRLMRAAVELYLGGRPLRSREMFRSAFRLGDSDKQE